MKKLQFCLVFFSLLIMVVSAAAQVQNGQFTGTITDPSGAAIANAKVTAVNPATNLSVAVNTKATGLYTLKELPPGSYKITAEAPGFRTSTNADVTLNAGTTARVDFRMQLGQTREIVEVTGEAAAVNTEDSKLAGTVTSTQIANLPLNGRNVYDLIQMAPGAVNVNGVDFENGHGTVVNGLREDFNGFLINGVSNKGLSGGVNNTPIQDTVQEFQQLQLNMSAQYGNSAGSTTNLVTKSGTNALHGSAWEYLRNSDADANNFFLNQVGASRPPLRWNQFGATVGGPIVKDKLFFFLSYQGSRFITSQASSIAEESPQWAQAVAQADTNTGVNSTANLLYSKFAPTLSGTPLFTADCYILGSTGGGVNCNNMNPVSDSRLSNYADYLCPDTYSTGLGASAAQAAALATRMQSILGVVPADNSTVLTFTGKPCSTSLATLAGTIGRLGDGIGSAGSAMPFQLSSAALFSSRTTGNLFNGNEYSGRLDYNWR